MLVVHFLSLNLSGLLALENMRKIEQLQLLLGNCHELCFFLIHPEGRLWRHIESFYFSLECVNLCFLFICICSWGSFFYHWHLFILDFITYRSYSADLSSFNEFPARIYNFIYPYWPSSKGENKSVILYENI